MWRRIIPNSLVARKVTEENLEDIAEWCGGSVRGIKLPRADQVVSAFYDYQDRELRAQIGDYIVIEEFDGILFKYVYSELDFNMCFERMPA